MRPSKNGCYLRNACEVEAVALKEDVDFPNQVNCGGAITCSGITERGAISTIFGHCTIETVHKLLICHAKLVCNSCEE